MTAIFGGYLHNYNNINSTSCASLFLTQETQIQTKLLSLDLYLTVVLLEVFEITLNFLFGLSDIHPKPTYLILQTIFIQFKY